MKQLREVLRNSKEASEPGLNANVRLQNVMKYIINSGNPNKYKDLGNWVLYQAEEHREISRAMSNGMYQVNQEKQWESNLDMAALYAATQVQGELDGTSSPLGFTDIRPIQYAEYLSSQQPPRTDTEPTQS